MKRRFYWDDWNREHITKHSVSIAEAEFVVRHSKRPFPKKSGEGKWAVWGRTAGNRLLQVLYVERAAEDLDFEHLTLEQIAELEESSLPLEYIIHARDLTPEEKSRYGRSQ